MFSFLKSKKEYDVLKLFKVVDLDTAKEFQTKQCLNQLLSFLNEHYTIYPDSFDLNYGRKVWNTLKEFKGKITELNNEDIVYLSAHYSSSKSRFSFTNDILNRKDVALSCINITLVLDKSFLNSSLLFELVKEMNNLSGFDYGYGFRISDEYDFDTERKYKKSFFGNSISITDDDIDSEKRKIYFKDGYVKKIYPLNFLNPSQLESTKTKDNIEKNIGTLSKLNENLFQWVLNDVDLNKIEKMNNKNKQF